MSHHHDRRSRKLRVERLEERAMLAGDWQLYTDGNQAVVPNGSDPQEFAEVDGVTYFAATTSTHGAELWRTNGSEAGTFLVKDLTPGYNGSAPTKLVNVNGVLYFRAFTSSQTNLWRSDGTASGTVSVGDASAAPGGLYATELLNFNGSLYFSTRENGLWRVSPQAGQPELIKQYTQNIFHSIKGLTSAGNLLYFWANDGTHGEELWRSDGTASGTVMLRDRPSTSYGANSLANVGGVLYYVAWEHSEYQLWRTDGSVAGTQYLRSLTQNSRIVTSQGVGYFIDGQAVWKLAPGATTPTLVHTFFDHFDRDRFPRSLVATSSGFALVVTEQTTQQLWVSNGSTTGALFVKELETPFRGSEFFVNDPASTTLAAAGNALYFTDRTAAGISQLWKCETNATGAVLLKEFGGAQETLLSSFVNFSGQLYFSANDGVTGQELWKSDASASTPSLVKDIKSNSGNLFAGNAVAFKNELFFSGYSEQHGQELWRTNGPEGGVVLVKDLNPTGNSYLRDLVEMNGLLYFRARSSGPNFELWKSDGTTAGTVKLRSLGATNSWYGLNSGLVNVDGVLYFGALGENEGWGLWKSDGTAGGTQFVKQFAFAASNTFTQPPKYLTNVSGVLYFAANDGSFGTELWRSDGTEAGTYLVRDISPGSGGSYPQSLVNYGGLLYFTAARSQSGWRLWLSDGTWHGSAEIVDSNSRTYSASELTVIGDNLFFVSYDSSPGLGKLSSPTSTPIIFETSVNARYLANAAGTLYFCMFDSVHGDELWTSNGLPNGAQLAIDFTNDSGSSLPRVLGALNQRIYATVLTEQYGSELWFKYIGPPLAGDYNEDGHVNNRDQVVWAATFRESDVTPLPADGNSNGIVDAADYTVWRDRQSQALPNPDYTRNGAIETADRDFWRTHFGAFTGIGLQADGNSNDVVDAADYTLWRDSYVLPARSGDYNRNNSIAISDRNFWQTHFGATTGVGLQADGNANGIVDTADYTIWRDALPVPAATTSTVAIASAAVSAIAPQPIAASPVRREGHAVAQREELPPLTQGAHEARLLLAREAAFAQLGAQWGAEEAQPDSAVVRERAPQRVVKRVGVKGLRGGSVGWD